MDDKISAVVGKLQQRLGDDYEVRIVDVTKNNDTVKKGISVRKNGEKIGRIYYWSGEALEAFLGDVESRSTAITEKENVEVKYFQRIHQRQILRGLWLKRRENIFCNLMPVVHASC